MNHRLGRDDPSMSSSEDHSKDGVENYEIIEQIASGVASYVYRARCKRGRLKNRLVALKKMPLEKTHSTSSLSLYLTLCHPSIVSLFSVFFNTNHRFQVLELCSSGSLSFFLSAHEGKVLHEGEARTVLRSILDAIVYLKKNSIVHRNINPDHVLLTEQCRIKLSSLDLATRLPSQDHTAIALLTRPEYIAPESLSRRPYDCRADLWSLGCLAFTCLVGKSPFEGPSTDYMFENILRARYTTPDHVSTLAMNFIASLLQVDPAKRQDLSSISFDPFFDSRLPEIPLTNQPVQNPVPVKTAKARFLPYRAPSSLQQKKVSADAIQRPTRLPLREIQNTDLRRILSDEISFGDRRVVSDPYERENAKSRTVVGQITRRHSSLNLSSRVRSRASSRPPTLPEPSDREQAKFPLASRMKEQDGPLYSDGQESASDGSSDHLPVGTTRPLPFNTFLLSTRVHKTINGQVTILPSHSLLVDFREGERRKGKSGTEVFVVSPDGSGIMIYSAPHLSIPCCLTEPTATYSIDTLPREYWSLYNEAASLTARLKQRTSRMVLHEPQLKCTLMANAPRADIELTLLEPVANASSSKSSKKQSSGLGAPEKESAKMRLRYSRQARTLEIAQCIQGPQGKEWTKRILSVSSLDLSSFGDLSSMEAEAIERLSRFTLVCEVAEEADHGVSECDTTFRAPSRSSSPISSTGIELLNAPDSKKPPLIKAVVLSDSQPSTNRVVSGSRTIAQSFSSVDLRLAPRPRKFSSMSKSSQEPGDILAPSPPRKRTEDFTYSSENKTDSFKNPLDVTPSWYRDGLCTTELSAAPGQPLQTRYIPSVGWCIRHNSKVSQGGRYKVMFLDGEILDIDVDEEWVEYVVPGANGAMKRQRRPIRESHMQRVLSERMKVFEEFVSMFDAAEPSRV